MSAGSIAAGAAAGVAVAALAGPLRRHTPATWRVRNFRGQSVTLTGGPLLAVAAAGFGGSPLGPAALVATGALLAGRYDDVAGARPAQTRDKGFAGHLAALRAGRVSAGVVKVVGIGAAGLAAACLRHGAPPWRPEPVLDGALIAGTANLVNLLDLRPGRALKVVLAVSLSAAAGAGPTSRGRLFALAGAAAGSLPDDLGERSMLGDAGANAAGALLGLALTEAWSRRSRLVALAVVLAATAASERVSFSAVIDATAPLRWLDRLGRPVLEGHR